MGQAENGDTVYTKRARYFDSENAFNIIHSPVPGHSFLIERDRAFDADTVTELIPLDQKNKQEKKDEDKDKEDYDKDKEESDKEEKEYIGDKIVYEDKSEKLE